mmetsp:Transcript_1872/g.4748  ORF Transcript_1872/g.4748 Transcript_1872/m.4748 type:complete len:505 (+) Transcript_1872:84-1598(+)
MGGAKSLPRRVNIVYGGRFALVIRESGDGPAAAISAQQVLSESKLRSSKKCKWKVQLDENDDGSDMTGSWRVRMRSDSLPHRVVKSGDKVMVEEKRNFKLNEHLWHIQFEDQEASGDSVAPPFTITSLSRGHSGMYLAIDEATSKVVLTSTKPTQMWTFHDASASTKSVQAAAQQPDMSGNCGIRRRGLSGDTSDATSKSAKETSISSFQSQDDDSMLDVFDGSAEDAVSAASRCLCESAAKFSSLSEMLKGYSLGADEEVVPAAAGATIHGIYSVLFGSNSMFRQRLADGENPQLGPIEKVPGAPWCARARLNQTIPAAMFGQCPLEENVRILLSKQEGRLSLTLHVRSCLTLPMKSFVSEQLHTFSQLEDGSMVLQSMGKAQSGFGHSKAVEGMKERRVIFCELVRELLSAAPRSQLCEDPQEASPGRDSLRGLTSLARVPLPKQTSVVGERTAAGQKTELAKPLPEGSTREALPCCAVGLMLLLRQLNVPQLQNEAAAAAK